MQGWLILVLIVIYHSTLFSTSAIAQPTQVPPASQQIAAAVLPLPEVMREHATVLGYAPDLSLVTLREGTNGMVCTASRPGDAEFDVRCYHESFMPVVRRMRDLHSRGVKDDEIYRTIDAEVKAKKLAIPDHLAAGHRMLGPISAYQPATNAVAFEKRAFGEVDDRILVGWSSARSNRGIGSWNHCRGRDGHRRAAKVSPSLPPGTDSVISSWKTFYFHSKGAV